MRAKFRNERPQGRRLLRAGYFSALSAALLLLLPTSVSAQFNARGRGPKASPTARQNPPRAKVDKAPDAAAGVDDAVLIARYRKLIIEQPDEEVPRKRLAELVRKRDGSLDHLLEEFQAQAETGQDKYAVLVAWGGLLLEDGQKQGALSKLHAATLLDPERPEAHLLLAALEEDLGDKVAARKSYEQVVRLSGGTQRSLALRSLRDLSLDLGDFQKAKQYHQKLVADGQGNLFIQGELGRALLLRGEIPRAVEELESIARAHEGDPRGLIPALHDLGQAQIQARNYDAAVSTLDRASRLSVQSPGQRIMIDTLLAEAHRGRGSLSAYLEELASSAHSAPRLGLLGRLYEEQGDTKSAISTYKKALASQPRDIDLRLRLVRLLELTGGLEEALVQYALLVKTSPNDVPLSLRYMEMLLAQGERNRVLKEFDRISRASGSDPEGGLLLLDFAEGLEEKQRATLLLARLAQETGGDPQLLVELGSHFYRKGQPEQARKLWKKILQVHSDPKKALLLYGEVLIDHEAGEEGIEQLRKAVALDKNDANSLRSLALGLERNASQSTGQDQIRLEEEALFYWKRIAGVRDSEELKGPQVVASAALRTQARRRVVRLWKKSGRLALELPPLSKSLKADPPDLDAGRLLTEGYLAAGRPDAGIETLEFVVRHAPGDTESLVALENAYRKGGNETKVLEVLKRLLRANPARSREYYERMASAAARQNDTQAALSYTELNASQNPNDPATQARLGDLYLAQGQEQKAETAYRASLKMDDRQSLVALQLAEIVARSGRNLAALDLLAQVIRSSQNQDAIRKASRQALGLALPIGEAQRVEDVLRPLAVSRPEEAMYRELLLEILGARMYPLIHATRHGTPTEQIDAEMELSELAKRSTGPLLSALAGDNSQGRALAIQLLSHAGESSSGTALLAFAQSAAPEAQRLVAALSVSRNNDPRVRMGLVALTVENGKVRSGRVADAALWSLCQIATEPDAATLLTALRQGGPTTRSIAALGLGNIPAKGELGRKIAQELQAASRRESEGPEAAAAASLALARIDRHNWTQDERHSLEDGLAQLAQSSHQSVAEAALFTSAQLFSGASVRRVIVEALTSTVPELRKAGELAARILTTRAELGENRGTPNLPPLLPVQLNPEQLSGTFLVQRALDETNQLSAEMLHSEDLRARAMLNLEPEFREEAHFRLRASRDAALATLEQLSSETSGFVGHFLTPDGQAQGADAEARARASECRRSLLPEVKILARSFDPLIARQALGLIYPADDAEALALLERSLSHPSREMQETALAILISRPTLLGVEALERHEKNEKRWASRLRLAKALQTLTRNTTDREVLEKTNELLRRLQSDKNSLVAEEASRGF